MRAFVATAGIIFALIAAAHVARLVIEGTGPLTDPIFIATSILSLGVTVWSAILLRRS